MVFVIPADSSVRLDLSSAPDVVRRHLGLLLSEGDTLNAAWQGGCLSATPGTAFFFGYQAAMRCVDSALPPDTIAAFCISEKGVRSLRDMTTVFAPPLLNGAKSHAMLAGIGLDRCYVVAHQDDDLVCAVVDMTAAGINVQPSGKPQPFMPDLPHLPLRFENAEATLFCPDANNRLNKPFRYWEDVHGLLALTGWLASLLPADDADALRLQASELAGQFRRAADAYSLITVDAVQQLLEKADAAAQLLPAEQQALWQRDRMLMVFTQPLRVRIREKLSAP